MEIPLSNDTSPVVSMHTVINGNGDGSNSSCMIVDQHHLIPIVEPKEVKIIKDGDASIHDKSCCNNDNIESWRGRNDGDDDRYDNNDDDNDDSDDEKYVVVNAIEVMESNQRVHPHDYNIEDDDDDQEDDDNDDDDNEEEEDGPIVAVAHINDDYSSSSINQSQPQPEEHQLSSSS